MRRILFFLNPRHAERGRRAMDRCMALARERNCEVSVCDTLAGGAAGEQARQVVTEGFDAIFACGGDGTVFRLLQGLAGTDAVLGVIPLGAGNVLARNLGLPRDPVAAFRAQIELPAAVPIRLGEAACGSHRWLFAFAGGVGMHAELMNFPSDSFLKRRLGRAAYFARGAGLLVTRPVQPFEAEITRTNGTVERHRVSELICTRVEWINRWRVGGNLFSECLRTVSVPETNRLGRARAFASALVGWSQVSGRGERCRRSSAPRRFDAVSVTCRRVGTPSHAALIPLEADGEFLAEAGDFWPLRIGVAAEQIRLLTPLLSRAPQTTARE